MDQMSGETKCSCLRSGPDWGSPACLATLLLWGPSWLTKSLYWHAKSPPVSHPRATEQDPTWGTADQGIHLAVPYRVTGGSQTFNLVAAGGFWSMSWCQWHWMTTEIQLVCLGCWTEPVHLTCWKWEPNWEKENVWKWEKAQDCDWTKIFSHTQAWPFRIIFITRGYRLLFPGVARLKLISFQSPQEGKVKPTPLLRRAALGSSENAIHLNKSN